MRSNKFIVYCTYKYVSFQSHGGANFCSHLDPSERHNGGSCGWDAALCVDANHTTTRGSWAANARLGLGVGGDSVRENG